MVFISTFQNRELQIMRKLEHLNIVKLKFFFYSAGEKVSVYVSYKLSLHHLIWFLSSTPSKDVTE